LRKSTFPNIIVHSQAKSVLV